MAEASYGFSPVGTYGSSYLYGGYSGSHAEYIRVPFADIGPVKLPDSVTDEQAVFISETFPTGYVGAENCHIQPGDTIAIWGCGAVGLFAMRSAYMLGADRVIAIDRFPNRLRMAKDFGRAEVINFLETDVVEELKQITGGHGPDACIDAISMEDHSASILGLYDEVKQVLPIETDSLDVLQQIIQACRKGGIVSMIGVHGGYVRQFPLGMAFAKDLTFRMGQMHAHRYTRMLIEYVALAEIDPAQIITHQMNLHDAPQAYEIFKHQSDECLRIVLKP